MSSREILKYFIKHILSYCLLLALTIIWLYAFLLMRKSPTSYIAIGEPNNVIWIVETIMFISIIIWSTTQIISKLKRGEK